MLIHDLALIGEHPALDLVNTVGNHLAASPGEWLRTYDDLVAWSLRAGIVTEAESARLRAAGAGDPAAASEALASVRAMREEVYRLLLGIVRSGAPSGDAVAALNRRLAAASPRAGLAWRDGVFHRTARGDQIEPGTIEARLLEETSGLLTSPALLGRLSICADDECGWMFLDWSRNRSRKWCSMADCGNRAKAARYYRRHRVDPASDGALNQS